jgi:hypothetical protein
MRRAAPSDFFNYNRITKMLVRAVGIELASLTSKSRQWKALPTALHSNC